MSEPTLEYILCATRGPLVMGNLANARQILSGPSLGVGLQPTPGRGVRGIGNQAEILGGPTAAFPPGASVTATTAGCIDFGKR